MKTLRGILSRFRVVREVFSFLWKRKLWWLMLTLVTLFNSVPVRLVQGACWTKDYG